MRKMKTLNFKRMISAALAALVVSTGIPAVFARDYTDVSADHPAKDEIDILSDIGVIIGTTEDTFSPDEKVTREQMALLLFRLMLNKQSGGPVNTSPFKDLYDDTYHGAISWANAAGYILGTTDSTFEPLAGISLQDAMTMLVRALGQSSDSMNKGYPWTYIDAGIKLGLDRGLENVAYTETLTRGEVAIILYNALTAEYLVPKNLTGGNVAYETTTIIEEVFGYEMDEATLVATNQYTLTGATVIKNGYVTLRYRDENNSVRTMTVKFSELGLEGTPEEYLGHTFKIMYSVNKTNKLVSVLSAVEVSERETFTSATVDTEKGHVAIGGTNYQIVENFSDALATNANELMLFAYENDRTLTQITALDTLNERLGLYVIDMIYYGEDSAASIAILRNFQVGQLIVDPTGKINLADNLTVDALAGGYTNNAKAENGDFVLYYFNSNTKELLLEETLSIHFGTVTRITNTSANIGGKTFTLGNEKAGIAGSTIAGLLTIGSPASVVVRGNEVLAVVGQSVVSENSQYLVVMSNPVPVFNGGIFRYVVTVNIDGVNQTIFTATPSVTPGNVYRYLVNGDTYTLIAPEVSGSTIATGVNKFVQNGFGKKEIALMINSAENTTIVKGENTFFTLSAGDAALLASEDGSDDLKFVTNSDTVILVVKDGVMQVKKGVYNASITVNDGAKVVAVFDNEVGTVESLRYLFVSDGSLGNYDSAAQSVRILAINGLVHENNTTYVEYTVFNYATGKVESRLSTLSELTVGEVYLIGSDGTIVDVAGSVTSGEVTGYTASTVTIGENTFNLISTTKIVKLNSDNTLTDKTMADAFGETVEYVLNGDVVTLIVIR